MCHRQWGLGRVLCPAFDPRAMCGSSFPWCVQVQDPDGWAISEMDYWWLGQQSCGWVTLSIPWGVLPQHTIGIAVGTVGV